MWHPMIALPLAGALVGLAGHPALTACAASPPMVTAPPPVVVATPTLNLRAAPRLSAPIVRVLVRGTILRVRFDHVSWIAVTTPDNTIGYVDRYDVRPLATASPIAPPTVAPAPPVVFRPPYRVVAVAGADVRAAPVRTAPVVAVLPRRTPLAVLAIAGTWARVTTRAGRVGWIALYLTVPL